MLLSVAVALMKFTLAREGVMVGMETMVMPGVTIGDGAVIGARFIVLKDVPPYAVVMEIPV